MTKKVFNSIVAFGDSHVAGAEIVDNLITMPESNWKDWQRSDELTKPLAFSAIVADYFGVPVYNYAMSGSSNKRNLRVLIEKIQDHPNSLIIFGYTSSGRTEFFIPNTNDESAAFRDGDFVQFIPTMCDTLITSAFKYFNKTQTSLANLYYKNLYYPRNDILEYSFIVDSICKLHAKMHLHLPLFEEGEVIEDLVDNVVKFGDYKNYCTWCDQNNYEKKQYSHYGIDAHKHLATLIIEQIERRLKNESHPI